MLPKRVRILVPSCGLVAIITYICSSESSTLHYWPNFFRVLTRSLFLAEGVNGSKSHRFTFQMQISALLSFYLFNLFLIVKSVPRLHPGDSIEPFSPKDLRLPCISGGIYWAQEQESPSTAAGSCNIDCIHGEFRGQQSIERCELASMLSLDVTRS